MSLGGQLNAVFARPTRKPRKAPASALVAIMPDGSERPVERTRNCGRTVYRCGQQSSSVLGDLAAGLGARIERR